MSHVQLAKRFVDASRGEDSARGLHTPTSDDVRHTNSSSLAAERRWLIVAGAVAATAIAVLVGHVAMWPPAAVAVVAVAAGWVDGHTGRIPNALTITGAAVVVAPIGLVSWIDQRDALSLLADIAVGVVLGGAPVVFAIWLFAPRLIGGGDWKLLAVIGGALGYLAPLAAAVAASAGFGVAIVAATVSRRRTVVLGPSLALGYLVALSIAVIDPAIIGATIR